MSIELVKLVADFYGLDVSNDMFAIVQDADVTLDDWTHRNEEARSRIEVAMNNKTNQLIQAQIDTANPLIRPGMDREELARYVYNQLEAARKN